MKAPMIAAAVLLALSGAALADDDCNVPMDRWQPREAVMQLGKDKGWTVQRIKVDEGCYEIRGLDAEGHAIRVRIDPGTLELIEMRIRYRK